MTDVSQTRFTGLCYFEKSAGYDMIFAMLRHVVRDRCFCRTLTSPKEFVVAPSLVATARKRQPRLMS